MPTPKKRKLYTFIYTDGVYLSYELTRDDYDDVVGCLVTGKNYAVVSIGVIGMQNIRSVIEQKEEEPTPETEDEPALATVPVLDQDSYNWIKQYMGGE